MLRWIGTNLRIFFFAFLLAIAVWVSAVTSTNPDETRIFPNPVPIEFIGQDPSLISTEQVPQDVQVTLRAPKSVWDELTSGAASIRAVADMTGLGAGTHSLDLQIQITARPVRLISVSPKSINLTLEMLVTRTLPITLSMNGEAAIGYQVGEPILSPTDVAVSGPQSLVSKIDKITSTLELNNTRQSIETTLNLLAEDSQGAVVSGVSIHPGSVEATVPLTQQGGYRDMAVKVVTVGRPATGYRLTSVAAFPPIVTVYSSNLALIDSLPGYVETLPLDLSGKSQNIDMYLTINLPSGVTMIGDQMVAVQVGIAPIEGSQTASYRPVEVIGLKPGFEAHVSPDTVDVILSGPLPVLDALQISDIHVQVDVSGLAPGTYQLTPTVKINSQQLTIDSILPGTVEVTVVSSATPTP